MGVENTMGSGMMGLLWGDMYLLLSTFLLRLPLLLGILYVWYTETLNHDRRRRCLPGPTSTLLASPLNLVEEGGLDEDGGDPVWVDVGGGSSVFQVAEALGGDMPGDSNRSTSVGDTGRERSHRSRLVLAGKTLLVVLSVDGNVFQVLLLELPDAVLDSGHTLARRSCRLCRVVRVATSTVPVALEGLGVERGLDSPLLSDTEQEESGHPEVVTHLDTGTWADLELPLGGHDFGVDTGDVDTGVETSSLHTVSLRISRLCRQSNSRSGPR